MDRAGSATDRSRMSYRQQECPGPATGRAMRKGHDAAKSGREEVSRQVLGHGSVEEGNGEEHEEEEEEEEKEEEEKEEESDYKDPSSSWGRRHSHGAPLGSSSSIKPLAPHKAIYDPAVYRPLLAASAASAASSSTNGASERASTPRAPASTASVAKRERRTKKAPSYMPLWHCDTCDDEVSVFLWDEHCRTKTHLRLARRAGTGGGGEPSAASGSGGGGGGVSVYEEAPESSAGYVGLLPAYTPLPGYKLRDTFYCPLCASEFPLSTEALHDEGSGVYMCVCCARRVHTAGEAVHAEGDVHQQYGDGQTSPDARPRPSSPTRPSSASPATSTSPSASVTSILRHGDTSSWLYPQQPQQPRPCTRARTHNIYRY